ncbi:beta-glucosidase [Flavobacterium jejuense]|uniref:Beta-glucosidase n=1 Tax=Flavobacterium jejuense TaxID=1544455 RepID=A0ABX0IQJ1_9FLAO|nr:glucoamylase family protein [Flavobacterium jejuense]NHN24159.1 beta-glucosidase [Flavobacterium jejuense]
MKNILFYSKLFTIVYLFSYASCSNSSDATTSEGTPLPTDTISYTDEELLNIVQNDAFKYFWNYAEVNSKLARERYHTDDNSFESNKITTGGSGFGLMTILVGIDRNFVSRSEAVSRLTTALDFLENADRFHGAWSHWIDGNTGNVIPFGADDDGGDLVETSFLCQGLIAVREYFKNGTFEEQALAQKADDLWKGVEWDWYTRGEDVLYWHWSPNYDWIKNFKLEGYNECLVTYVMAAASPTHPISATAYHQGWARNGAIVTSGTKYNIPLIFNHNGATGTVGPMFWAHYSYLGLDPRGLTDQYANYWNLNKNHTDIIYQYCINNPQDWVGYNDKCWGLTASYTRNSDGTTGYTAHQPNNDKGVITPTAALSSFPYKPDAAMRFLRYLYEEKKNNYVGVAGPYDAFSPQYNWVTPRYLAIDQGTIAPMIENHRTGLLWNLFMQAPEIQAGLQSLGFSSTQHGF